MFGACRDKPQSPRLQMKSLEQEALDEFAVSEDHSDSEPEEETQVQKEMRLLKKHANKFKGESPQILHVTITSISILVAVQYITITACLAPIINNILKVHQCKEKTVKAAHPFCVAPPFFQPRLHTLCAIHLCPHHPPKVWPAWVFGKLENKSKNLRACVENAILAAAPLQWATL